MLKEYGLDPALLHNWDKFRFYFLNSIGVSKGRWILGLPSKNRWRRAVYDSLDDSIKPIQRQRITEKLRSDFKEKVIACNYSNDLWNDTTDWLTNAEIAYETIPFQSIVSMENPRNKEYVIIDEELDEDDVRWKVQSQADINRCAQDMASSIQLLLQKSKCIVFIDQHFKPKLPRYTNPLQAFIDIALNNRINDFEHICYFINTERYVGVFQDDCENSLPQKIPHSLSITFKEITQKPNGERIHERFILTDIGGVKIDGGLDEGNPGETTPFTILTDDTYKSTWDKYMSDNPAFDLGNEFTVQGTRGGSS